MRSTCWPSGGRGEVDGRESVPAGISARLTAFEAMSAFSCGRQHLVAERTADLSIVADTMRRMAERST